MIRSWIFATLSLHTLPFVFKIWWVHFKILSISILKIVVNFNFQFFLGVTFVSISEQVLQQAHVVDMKFIVINLVLSYECFQVRIFNIWFFKAHSVLHEFHFLHLILVLLNRHTLHINLVLVFERVLRKQDCVVKWFILLHLADSLLHLSWNNWSQLLSSVC